MPRTVAGRLAAWLAALLTLGASAASVDIWGAETTSRGDPAARTEPSRGREPPLAPAGADAPAPRPAAFVTIPPQAWFVERIGGDHVEVDSLVGPGQSPHTFEPTPGQMARLARARVFFRIGWPFEDRLLEKAAAANPALRVVDTREGVPLRRMTPAEAHADDHAGHAPPAGGRAAPPAHDPDAAVGAPDPHIWLNPRYAKVQAATMARALEALDPARAADYRRNLQTLQDDLDRLDARLAEVLAPLRGREFLVFHPAFGYFADAYGLRQVPVEVEGKEPSARQLAALVDRARGAGVRVIFVQPQFSARSAEALARAIGGAVVPLDPLARDYAAGLLDMADKVRRALAPPAAAPPAAAPPAAQEGPRP